MSKNIFTLTLAMIMSACLPAIASAAVMGASNGGNPLLHAVGYQTFENSISGNNNSGIADDTADSNSTFDPTPVGSNNGGLYLTTSIGPNASGSGWDGRGQNRSTNFLNGPDFGNSSSPPGIEILDVTLADGSPGVRIGPNGGPTNTGSSWKFSQLDSPNQLLGDISITNESDYAFRLERIHFDARGKPAATSPDTLDLLYLASPANSNLRNVSTGTEVANLKNFYSNTWASVGIENVSVSVSGVLGSASRINPGESASFRFRWSGATGNGEAQLDNIAFAGTFLDPSNGFAPIDPVAVTPIPEPSALMLLSMAGLAAVCRRRN